MDLPEATTHSFIIKIWLEEVADETGDVTWRGHITHVPSGMRRYLRDLDDVTDFILIYLEAIGVRPRRLVRLRRWVRRTMMFRRARG
jgi:hypothetical protein